MTARLGITLGVALIVIVWNALAWREEAASTVLPNAEKGRQIARPQGFHVRPDSDDLTIQQQEVAWLRHEVSLLRDELNTLRRDMTGKSPGSLEAEDVTVDEEDLSPQALADIAREAHIRHEKHMQTIETALIGEGVDAGWAQQADITIKQAFMNEAFNSASLVDVDCRSTLCRVEVVHDSREALQHFTASFPAEVSSVLPQMTMLQMPNEDGSVTSVVYLARQGHGFPS